MRRLLNRCCAGSAMVAIAFSTILILPLDAIGQTPTDQSSIQAHLDAGEYPAALELAQSMKSDDGNRWFGKISKQQLANGATKGAFETAGRITDDRTRAGTLTTLYRQTNFDEQTGRQPVTPRRSPLNGGMPNGQGGGITIQDFQPLVDLIKSTIKPDDWDDTNGDGTIQPYPAGVYVDPVGTLQRVKNIKSSSLNRLRQNSAGDSGNRLANIDAPLRKVSITRLEKAAQMAAAEGRELSDEMKNLAGIYEVKYLMVYPESGDIVVAGPAGEWIEDRNGRRLNKKTGKPVLQLDDLVVCLRNAWSNDAKFGCTITPRQDNLVATKEFLASSKLKGKSWREALRKSLGQQDIKVFGIDPKTHAGRVIVEADYRMKLVGMGLEPSINEVPSYLSRVQPNSGTVPMDVIRWWFTLNYDDVVADASREVFAFTGSGVKVLSENELLDDQGNRIHTGKSDLNTSAFARDFTKHFDKMADRYPVYRQLKNVFDLSLVSAIVRDQALSKSVNWNLTYFGEAKEYGLAYQPHLSHAPKQVDSVMNHRVISERKKSSTVKHTVVGVSGGVAFDAMQVASDGMIKTDSDGKLEKSAEAARPTADHWWWD